MWTNLPVTPDALGPISLVHCPVCQGTGRYSEHSRSAEPGLSDEDIGELDGTCEGTGVRLRVTPGGEAVLALVAVNAYTSSGAFESGHDSLDPYDNAVAALHRVIGTHP